MDSHITCEGGTYVRHDDRRDLKRSRDFPPGWRGVHIALADYIDNQLEEAVYAVALADELAHYRRQGLDREALWRLIRERKFGAGFVDRTIANTAANWERARIGR